MPRCAAPAPAPALQEELAATQGVMQQLQTTVQRLEQGTAALETQLAQAHEQIGRNELALFDVRGWALLVAVFVCSLLTACWLCSYTKLLSSFASAAPSR